MITIKQTRAALLATTIALVAGASLATTVSAQASTPASTPDKAPAVKAAAASPSGTVSHANSLTPDVKRLAKGVGVAAETKALESYWTPARMKAAKSLDHQVVEGSAPAARASTPQGPAKSIKGAAPTTTPRAITQGVVPQYSYPNFPASHPTARTVGKVFFSRTLGGSTWNFVCSGAIVNTEGKSTVWTAGHCVYDYANGANGTRVWDSNFAFVPSYSAGSRPYGTWYARSMTTTSGWYYNRDFNQDNGAAFVNRNFGYRIADYLGAQGIQWNVSASYYANAFGYPQAYPFNGAYLVQASAATYAAGGSIYMYSGLTGGSSGGPWLRAWNGSYGYINGHNDYIFTASPSYMYSPYYGNQVSGLYNAVRYQSA